jgi:hypothetical protein
VAAEGEYRRPVALEGDLEGRVVATPDLVDESRVAREGEEAPRQPRPRCGSIDITHLNAVGA